MLSIPPASTSSHCPDAILLYAISIAVSPDAHCVSTVKAGTFSDIPALSNVNLPIFPPGPIAFPQINKSGFSTKYFLFISFINAAPNFSGRTFLNIPFLIPM